MSNASLRLVSIVSISVTVPASPGRILHRPSGCSCSFLGSCLRHPEMNFYRHKRMGGDFQFREQTVGFRLVVPVFRLPHGHQDFEFSESPARSSAVQFKWSLLSASCLVRLIKTNLFEYIKIVTVLPPDIKRYNDVGHVVMCGFVTKF